MWAARDFKDPAERALFVEKMLYKDNTIKNNHKVWNKFTKTLERYEMRAPYAIGDVEFFLCVNIDNEYYAIPQLTSIVIKQISKKNLWAPHSSRDLAERHLRGDINRVIANSLPNQATPLFGVKQIKKQMENMSSFAIFLTLVWWQTGLRASTIKNMLPQDIAIGTNAIEIQVRHDKIGNTRGRRIIVGCNCTGEHKNAYCPLHHPCRLDHNDDYFQEKFPPEAAVFQEIHNNLGTTNHSIRRGLAIAMLLKYSKKTKIDLGVFLKRMGWSTPAMWLHYAKGRDSFPDANVFMPTIAVERQCEAKKMGL